MALDRTLIKVATKLIKQFGQSATLHTVTEGEYSPTTGTSTTEVTTPITIFLSTYSAYEYAQGVAVIGDVPAYCSTLISQSDNVTVNGKIHAVIRVDSYNVKGSNVLYVAQLRALQ